MNALVPATGMMTFADVERLGTAIARSQLFGIKTPDQAIALMMIAHAEGRHPALAARDYDIIQGRPSKKAEAMLRDFLEAGGHVEWHALTDDKAEATFKHKQGGSVRISWDMARAQRAGLKGKDMYTKFPRQMLRSRCISEGVRTIWPGATSGMYVPEEITTIEHEADAPSARDQINAEVPIPAPAAEVSYPPPNPKQMNDRRRKQWESWLVTASTTLSEAKTSEAVDEILARDAVMKAVNTLDEGTKDPDQETANFFTDIKDRFDELVAKTLDRVAEQPSFDEAIGMAS